MSEIDRLLLDIDSGVLLITSTHDEVRCNPLRMTDYEGALADDTDFRIITRNFCADFAAESEDEPPYTSRIDEMPINRNPDHPDIVEYGWDSWPIRGKGDCPEAVTGLTIHHTMSHSPLAVARYCTNSRNDGGKGLPSTQYHFWVSQEDGCPVWQLAPMDWALWHDHTGTYQMTLSIGMAGRLHESKPPDEHLGATARLVVYLQRLLGLPLSEVQGHDQRAREAKNIKTDCPGWLLADWRDAFYIALENET